jgi:hypothetical protein
MTFETQGFGKRNWFWYVESTLKKYGEWMLILWCEGGVESRRESVLVHG